jgi:general secretion pathway protein E/type IV pilus assembly protein PilB
MVARRAPARELRNAARAAGYRTLVDDGMRRVMEGLTTLDEVSRVVDLTDRLS